MQLCLWTEEFLLVTYSLFLVDAQLRARPFGPNPVFLVHFVVCQDREWATSVNMPKIPPGTRLFSSESFLFVQKDFQQLDETFERR